MTSEKKQITHQKEMNEKLNNVKALMEQQKQRNGVNFFWKEWLGGKQQGPDQEDIQAKNGWADDDDLSDYDEDPWTLGGMRRPGEKHDEEYTSEEAMWDDDDDDDHGGEMMPVPGL